MTCHHNFVDRGLGPGGCYACHKAWGTTELRRIDAVFREGDRWEVVVAQNTNLIPGAAPEEEGIGSPIPMPDATAR